MIEEFLTNAVIEARRKNITLEELTNRLNLIYADAEKIDEINRKSISEISKKIELLLFKKYKDDQIKLYITAVDEMQMYGKDKKRLVEICQEIDNRNGYKKGYTYGRVNTITNYILVEVMKFDRFKQRDFKKLLKPIYSGSIPFVKCLLHYEFDIEKILEAMR